MEETKKKSNTGIIILVLILLVAVGAGGCFAGTKLIKNDCDCDCDVPKCAENGASVKALEDGKDIVFTKESISEENDGVKYEYELPFINIDSDYAKEVNNEIEKKYRDYETIIKNKEFGGIVTYLYKYFENGNIISLVTYWASETDNYIYESYNINKTTGLEVSDFEIFKAAGITKNDYNKKIGDAFGKYFDKLFSPADQEDVYEESRSINVEGISSNRFGYFVMDGKLGITGTMKQIAGADYNGALFDLEGNALDIFGSQTNN